MKRNYNSYLSSINVFEKHLMLLDNFFLSEIKNKFYSFFLMHLVSWQKKDSINSNLLDIFSKESNDKKVKSFLINVFFLVKFFTFFLITLIIKIVSYIFFNKFENKKFLISFPRVNDTFYEKDINLSNKVKNSILFEFIYSFKDVFLIKKKYFIFIKYISLFEIFHKFYETIIIFYKYRQVKKKKKSKKFNYLLNDNDYNFFNIFLKLIQIHMLGRCIKTHKIKIIISNALPTSVDSKIFKYISNDLNIKYCCFITKLICKNNLGYSFKKNKKLYPDFYFINSNQNVKILKLNKYSKNNYYLFKNKSKKDFLNLSTPNDTITILYIFTRNELENSKLINILDFTAKKIKNIKIYYKYHPQGYYDKKIRDYLKNEAIDISNFSNNKIEKIFIRNFDKKIVITSFSSYVYKILNLGFLPIWLKGFGDLDFLFKDITNDLGIEINLDKNLFLAKKKIVKILKKNKLNLTKNIIFSSDYIKFKDFNNFLKNFDRIYSGR